METLTISRHRIMAMFHPVYVAFGLLGCLIALALSTPLFAQGPCICGGHGTKVEVTSTGQEFLLCYDQNELPEYTDANYQDIFLATLNAQATITITCKHYPSFKKVFTMAPNSSQSYRLSNDIDPLINTDEVMDNTIVHVVSDAPIVCYGFNHKQYTTDAFLALPKNVAQTDYRVMSYANSYLITAGNQRESEFSVAAFDSNTHVTITPSALTLGGKPAGVPQIYTLNAGEGVQIQADENTLNLDLTGSHVTSDGPIVVYGAHVRAEVPVGYQVETNTTSRDHLSEELPGTSQWGNAFVCTNFLGRSSGDIVRVLAENPNTNLKINGNLVMTLGADQWFDTLINGPIAIETDQPSLVGMLSHTATTLQGLGDPFLAIAPPVNQTYNDFTFFSSDDVAYTLNALVIVTEQTGVGRITLDGTLIPAASFTPIPTQLNGMNWSIATISLNSPGGHHITSTNDETHGFTILAYGYGRVDSYGYTAGALLKPLRGVFASGGNQAGIIDRPVKENTVNVRDILASRVYLDSAVVLLDGDAGKFYTASVRENVAYGISYLEMGDDVTLHLDVNPPITEPMMATFKCYTHTAKWFDLEPGITRVKLLPLSTAGVQPSGALSEAQSIARTYPNPFTNSTTISFTLPRHADISLKVYDDLGRLVTTLANSDFAAGPYDIRFEQPGLAAGHYTYVLKSESLNIWERHSLIFQK